MQLNTIHQGTPTKLIVISERQPAQHQTQAMSSAVSSHQRLEHHNCITELDEDQQDDY